MSAVVPFVLQNVLEHSKAAHTLPHLVFFAEAEKRDCVSFLLSACFPMIQYSREKPYMKDLLSSTDDYSG